MNRMRTSLTLGLPLALVLGVGTGVGLGPAVDLTGAVAVVDIEAVHEAFPLSKQRQAEFEAQITAFQTKLAGLEAKFEEKKLEAESFVKGSSERDMAEVQVGIAKAEWDLQGQLAERAMNKMQREIVEEVNRELRKGIQEFARQKGYQIVLRKRSVKGRFQVESDLAEDVIYAIDALDITDAAIQFLQAAPKPDGK